MLQVIYNIFPLLFVIVLAFILKKTKAFEKNEMSRIASFLGFDIVLPALVFQVFSTAKLSPSDVFLPLIAIVYTLITLLVFFILIKIFKLKDRNIILLAATGLNAGALYPFVELQYSPEIFSKFLLLDIGGTFIIFTLMLWIGAFLGEKKFDLKSKELYKNLFINPVIIAIVLGVGVNLLNLDIPEIVNNTTTFIGAGFGLLVAFVVGVNFEIPNNLKIFLNVLLFYLVRLSLAIIIALVSASLLNAGSETKIATLMFLISPVAMITVVYAEKNKLDSTLASQYVTISLFICILLLPFFVWLAELL